MQNFIECIPSMDFINDLILRKITGCKKFLNAEI